jgi:hypothetical protein
MQWGSRLLGPRPFSLQAGPCFSVRRFAKGHLCERPSLGLQTLPTAHPTGRRCDRRPCRGVCRAAPCTSRRDRSPPPPDAWNPRRTVLAPCPRARRKAPTRARGLARMQARPGCAHRLGRSSRAPSLLGTFGAADQRTPAPRAPAAALGRVIRKRPVAWQLGGAYRLSDDLDWRPVAAHRRRAPGSARPRASRPPPLCICELRVQPTVCVCTRQLSDARAMLSRRVGSLSV